MLEKETNYQITITRTGEVKLKPLVGTDGGAIVDIDDEDDIKLSEIVMTDAKGFTIGNPAAEAANTANSAENEA